MNQAGDGWQGTPVTVDYTVFRVSVAAAQSRSPAAEAHQRRAHQAISSDYPVATALARLFTGEANAKAISNLLQGSFVPKVADMLNGKKS